ncbi:hypothetical protein T440DRAFT_497687 [Plenodomus tracheiphilus IPT5]|uniref:Zn(2)-C6 fungal-type domain-containing protein n=1 Tax=Plenodomus tracheiphilus IPT5 TaxID=1408161 RepID=A0A6A7BAZ1_9PLEO|nr:hypothetical protein T440DRAFT_497687 [Plenodomus tracheiphilus IPT5]
MDDLEDDLDLRFHKGLEPDVYYRCPTLEVQHSLSRTNSAKTSPIYASNLIPTGIVTEFLFAAASTLTIPVTEQFNLDALIQPADFLQSITVEHALCRDFDAKDRLKAQRAISRSIVEAIEEADGFKYIERSVTNIKSGDGARIRYFCKDSTQGRVRGKPAKHESEGNDGDAATNHTVPTFECGGAIHVKFSIKREAINVVYKHNSIHTHSEDPESMPTVATTNVVGIDSQAPTADATNGTKKRKRKSKQIKPVRVLDDYRDPDMAMPTFPEAPRSLTKKSRKKNSASTSVAITKKVPTKKGKQSKDALSPASGRKNTVQREPSPPPRPVKNKACLRCREKKIECIEAKPSCNQCQRGLWACQYEAIGNPKRSKNGCINCKQRRRKCTEEKPYCAYCLRIDDDCGYADFSYTVESITNDVTKGSQA